MDDLSARNNERGKTLKRLIVILRCLLGGGVGCMGSVLILLVTFFGIFGPLAFVIQGQYMLFEYLIDSAYLFFSGQTISYGLSLIISISTYSLIWSCIGALMASGSKRQMIAG